MILNKLKQLGFIIKGFNNSLQVNYRKDPNNLPEDMKNEIDEYCRNLHVDTLEDKLFCIAKGIDKPHYCPTCGKEMSIKNYKKVYCCQKCSQADGTPWKTKFHTRVSTRSKDVVENANKKREETCIEKYGTKNVFSKGSPIQKSLKTIYQNKLGVDNPSYSPEIINKIQETWRKKYPLGSVQREKIHTRMVSTKQKNKDKFERENGCTRLSKLVERFHTTYWRGRLNIPETVMYDTIFISNQYIQEIEKFCKGIDSFSSEPEKEIYNFISNIYKDNILVHDRKVIAPLEIDLYLPKLQVGIEFNGTYWHSKKAGLSRSYHQNKSLQAEKKGVHIIHIWEWEWNDPIQKEKIKDLLRITLHDKGINRIFARHCEVRKITNKEARPFNEQHHLQGHRNAQLTYGLFYKNSLVQLMSFSKTDYNRNTYEWEIIRGCPSSNNIVVGGVEKLFSKFVSDNNPDSVFSYSDFNKFSGNSYSKIGMKYIGLTSPNKWLWLENGQVVNRKPSQYHELKEKTMTEIWGAGSKKFVWKRGVKK